MAGARSQRLQKFQTWKGASESWPNINRPNALSKRLLNSGWWDSLYGQSCKSEGVLSRAAPVEVYFLRFLQMDPVLHTWTPISLECVSTIFCSWFYFQKGFLSDVYQGFTAGLMRDPFKLSQFQLISDDWLLMSGALHVYIWIAHRLKTVCLL